MDLVAVLSVLAVLFLLIGLGEPLAVRLRLPFTVFLALAGILIGALAIFLLQTEITDAFDAVARSVIELPVSSEAFLYIFLPTLLFQVALTINLRRMIDDWVPIFVMAVLAVVVATFFIGYALLPFGLQPLAVCLVVGAIVATTDPSAVVSIFRDIGAPGRLTRLVEGESLLNDAAAIALFGLFMALTVPWAAAPDTTALWLGFFVQLLGGALAGLVAARIAVAVMERLGAHRLGQVSVSLALPFLIYIAAEQLFDVSGVVAVVAAGMTLNLLGPGRLPPANWAYLRDTWELLAHWANSLVFILAALLVPRFLGDIGWTDLGVVAAVVAAAIAARAVILFGLLPVLGLLRLSPRIGVRFKIVLLWGGLRGAVTLALVLAVSEDALLPEASQRFIAVAATGFTLFTLLVQGPTLRPLIRRLGLDSLPPIEAALQRQVVAVALQNVREAVADTARRHEMTPAIVRSEAKRFAERLDAAVTEAEGAREILDRDRLTLGLVTLAGREREMVLEGFRERVISSELVERLLSDSARLIDATRIAGRSAYRQTARANIALSRAQRIAHWLHRVLRLSRPLSQIVRRRFEVLLINRMILRDLHEFVDAKILRIHGRRVADLLHDVLRRRTEEVDRELEGMRLQYPGFAEQLERVFLRKLSLRLEEREIDANFDDGLIGPELYRSLIQSVRDRRLGLDISPRLDLAGQKYDLVTAMPLFRDLPENQRRELARAVVTIFVQPGEIIIRRGTAARAVFFIASGAVERDFAVQRQRLGSGEFFGEIALLQGLARRSGQVRAITHSTLLQLDEARFLRLLARSPELREALIEAAQERGQSEVEARAMVEAAARRSGARLRTQRKPRRNTARAPAPEARNEADGSTSDAAPADTASPDAAPSQTATDTEADTAGDSAGDGAPIGGAKGAEDGGEPGQQADDVAPEDRAAKRTEPAAQDPEGAELPQTVAAPRRDPAP